MPVNVGTFFRRFGAVVLLAAAVFPVQAQRQMEKLGRGVVVLHSATSQAYIGWRLLVTDPTDIGFNVYRVANGGAAVKLNSAPVTNTTDYLDTTANFTVTNYWYVTPTNLTTHVAGTPSAPYGLAANSPVRQYVSLPLQPVTGGLYPPYDVKFSWVGDFDGDGEYDYLVDRLSTSGSVNQYLQAYKRDGTLLWQMDMGYNSTNQYNIEPGASAISVGHGDMVTVYDLDGDGKAEVCVRTARGVVLPDSTVITGPDDTTQYLSILNGLTGAELARTTITNMWPGDGPMNGHFGIMYCDGVRPSVVLHIENRQGSGGFQREIMTYDYRAGQLTRRWFHTPAAEANESWGHQIRIMDVNHDGIDDMLNVGSALNGATGQPLWDTELVHGDRFHITDIDPDRPGLEMFSIQQNNSTLLATALIDTKDGSLIKKWYAGGVVDVGRGSVAELSPDTRGIEFFSTQPGIFDCKGNQIYANGIWPTEAIWWDADLSREFEAGAGSGMLAPTIDKFSASSGALGRLYSLYNEDGGCHQAYGGRAAIWGDLFGDWREEFMVVADDFNSVRVYTTKTVATNRLYCLAQNPAYRCQMTCRGYYQAGYVDYFLGTGMPAAPIPPISDAKLVWRGVAGSTWDASTANWFTNNLWVSNNTAVAYTSGDTVLFDTTGSNSSAITLSGSLTPGEVRVHSPKSYTFSGSGSLTGAAKLTKGGAGRLTFTGTNTYSGATLISEGEFFVNGSLPGSPVTVRGGVWLDGRLGGSGSVGGAVTIGEGGGVSPGQGTNSPGTLTLTSTLKLTGRTLNDFDLSDDPTGVTKTNDRLVVNGVLTLQGTNTFVIRKLNATLPPGVYPLITYSGTLTGGLTNLTFAGIPGIPAVLTNPPGQIALLVKTYRAPATITWTGGQGGNAWDLLVSSNWLNGAVKDRFAPGDTVRFDNTGATNLTVTLTGDLTPTNVIVDSSSNYVFAGSGSIIGNASLLKTNSGTLTITAVNNTYTGKTTVAGGTLVVSELDAVGFASPLGNPPAGATNLVLSGNATLRILAESYTDRGMTLNSGTNSIDVANAADQLTVAGLIAGSGAFQKLGAGALGLTGSNAYTGQTFIRGGSVSLGGDDANQYGFGPGPGGNGNTTVTLENSALRMYDNTSSYNHAYWNLIVPTNSTSSITVDGRCFLHGALTGGGTFNYYTYYYRTELDGDWSGFTGRINVSGGYDFRIGNSYGYANAAINLAACYLYHISGSAVSIGELSGNADSIISGGSAWTIGAKNTDATFSGKISSGSITKVGTGTWTIDGTNTYTGTTTASNGVLRVNGDNSASTGAVTVRSTGTLGGSGVIGGATTVNGKLSLADSAIGTLTFTNNLTLAAGSTTTLEINRAAAANDLVDGNATVTYGGTLVVSNLSGTFVLNDSFKIFDAATYAGGFSGFVLPALNAGLAWSTTNLIANGTINVVDSGVLPPVPAAPTNLVAVAVGYAQINLTWADASTNEVSFLVESSTDGVNFTEIASLGAGVTNYSDTGLSPATLRYYRVRASNTGGFSPYSNIATTSTPLPLIWRGDGAGNAWNIGVTANWRSNNVASLFANGAAVIFDDTGSNNTSVSLSGAVSPYSVSVTAAKNYTFAGAGQLAGSGALLKSGSGNLNIGISNSYSGGTLLAGGTIVFTSDTGNTYGLGSGLLTISNATLSMYDNTSYDNFNYDIIVPADATATVNADSRCDWYGSLTGGGTVNFRIPSNRTTIFGDWSAFAGVINALPSGTGGKDFRIGPDYSWPGLPNAALNLGTNVNFYWTGNLNSGSPSVCDLGELSGVSSASIAGGTIGGRSLNYRVGWINTDATYAGRISDQTTGSPTLITKVGGGKWILSGTNTYSGITTVSLGTLQFGDGGTAGTLPTNGIVNNAALAFNRADNLADTGVISGTGSVSQDGDGVVTFTKSHTYSGATLITSGTLALSGSGAISNSSITLADGALLDVSARTGGSMTLASGKTLSGYGSVKGGFVIASGAKLTPGSSLGTLTFSNNLTLLAGSTTTIEIGTLPSVNDKIVVNGTLAYGGSLVVTNIGGHALAAGDSFQIISAAAVSGVFSSITLPPLAGALFWDTNLLYSAGTISVALPSPRNLVWKGDGVRNSWDNNVTQNWLDTNNAATYFNDLDSVTFNGVGSNNSAIFLSGAIQPAAVTVNASKDYAFTGGAITGICSLVKAGTGTLTLLNANDYSGDTVISNGTVVLAASSGLAHRWSFNNSLADSVGNSTAAIVDVGTSNVTLTATNLTLAGGTRTTADYVSLGTNLLPNTTAPVTIELWARQNAVQNWSRIFDFGTSTAENLYMSWTMGTTLASDRVEWIDTVTTTSDNTSQPYTLGTEFHIVMVIEPGTGAGGNTRVTWYRAAATNATLGDARGTFTTTNTLASFADANCWLGRSEFTGDNTASASYNEVRLWQRALTTNDLQTLHTAGANAVIETLNLAASGGALPAASAVNLAGTTGKLENASGQSQTIGSLAGVAGSEVKLTSGGLIAGGNNASTEFAGFLSGTNGFTKTGSGTLTLSGTNTHTGGTTVSAGTLLVNGNNSAATGAVFVASGATLGGGGSLGGAATVQAGGTLSPGNSIGTLTFTGSLTLGADGTNFFEISAAAATNDVVNVSGALTGGGLLVVTNITTNALVAGDSFKLFNAGSYGGAFGGVSLPTLASNLTWSTNALNTSGRISVIYLAPPRFGSASLIGGNMIFASQGGTPGMNCYVLSSTNLLLPLANWTRLATNVFDANGSFAYTNVVSSEQTQNFYRLLTP